MLSTVFQPSLLFPFNHPHDPLLRQVAVWIAYPPCEETCRNIFDLEVAQARADGIACALACTAGALTGVTACAAGSFFFFPVCAGTILLAQAVCEAGCWVARAADIKGHEANLLRCLAGCVPPVISPRPPAAEVGGSSITPR